MWNAFFVFVVCFIQANSTVLFTGLHLIMIVRTVTSIATSPH